MAANSVQIDIVAKDLASAALQAVQQSLMKIGGTAGAIGLAFVATGAAIATGMGKAISTAQQYDQQVKELMLSTGGTALATSKLIQTVDDAGVSYETLKTAMKFAVRNGIEPNIEALARLSDAYLSLGSGVERGQLLLKSFGRSGLDMARVMDLGSVKILEMSRNTEEGLNINERAIAQSEEYRMNIDKLNDSWLALWVTSGNKLIPVLNDVAKGFTDQEQAMKNLGLTDVRAYQVQDNLNIIAEVARIKNERSTKAINEQWKAIYAYIPAGKELNAIVAEAGFYNESFFKIVGAGQSVTENYAKSMRELDEAFKKGKVNQSDYSAGLEKINGLREQSNNQIIFGLMQTKLAIEGTSDAEVAALGRAGVALGIHTQAELDSANARIATSDAVIQAYQDVGNVAESSRTKATTALDGLTKSFLAGGMNVSSYTAQVKALLKAIRELDGAEATAFVNVITQGSVPNLNGNRNRRWGGAAEDIGFADGGISRGPASGHMELLHGNEAVIPLKNGSVPISGGGGMTVNLTYAPAFSTASSSEFLNNITPMLNDWYRRRLAS